jgi:hypothetical protein
MDVIHNRKSRGKVHLAASCAALSFVAFPAAASAVVVVPLSEPGLLGLLAVGAVVGLAVWARNRRK